MTGMATDNTESWDRIARRRDAGALPTDTIAYGPDVPTEQELRLLGELSGRRVLDLGCGSGASAVAFARQGATVIAVDASNVQLTHARALADRGEARVEWHLGDLADLAFLRADSIDIAFSAHAMAEVVDVGRVFRQVHRVLRPHGVFVLSYEHPLALLLARELGPGGAHPANGTMELPLDRLEIRRSYFDESPIVVERDGEPVTLHPRTVSSVFMGLTRAGFRVEVVAEPPPSTDDDLPVAPTIVWRARKEGL
jgi:SAM-dependent methyltransferase